MKSFYLLSDFYFIIKKDLSRYGKNGISHPGFLVVLSFRVRKERKKNIFLFLILIIPDIILEIIKRFISDTTLPSNLEAGEGLFLPHPNGVIINSKAKIGNNVSIFQQVTIGEWRQGSPTISNNTSLYAGSKVFGAIKIGSYCKIGPNCVIRKNIPDFCSVQLPTPLCIQYKSIEK